MFEEKEKDIEVKYIDIEDAEIFDSANEALEAKRAKQNEKNKNFIQISRGLGTKALAYIISQNPVAGQLYMFFIENMDVSSNSIMVSHKVLEEAIGKSRTTIFRAVSCLEENGLIAIGKVGNTNVYILNPEVAWATSRDKKDLVNFKGNILLGRTENEELFQKFERSKYVKTNVLR
ncbi:replication/maintenance protein RepL [Bacillus toyonensis]|uniref:replication/maintenance protein RepL n=1 Tax=Bacillus toyonensis TaxID=155322 RepID=UPI002E1B9004|nr:replication/maintenance protein RepL [Bacillus toyonensis]MED3087779.1 replication/maintenance protein RepL [Bacillus toyonensis]